MCASTSRFEASALTLSVLPKAQLSQDQKTQIIRLCTAAYNEDYNPLFALLEPECQHVLGFLEGELVSHAACTTRWFQVNQGPLLRTAYIEGVATAPRYQRCGFGSLVMQRVAQVIADYDVGGLSTGEFYFYARLGWERWRGPLAVRTEQGLVHTPEEQGVMILRLPRTSPDLDLDGLLTVEWQPGEVW